MITITRFDKSNTIIQDSQLNMGINPILQLGYGNGVSRGIIYFNHDKVKNLVCDKTYPDITKLKHILKMTNCGSINIKDFDDKLIKGDGKGLKERATSFDLIFFLIPQDWDSGRGFDYGSILWNCGNSSMSTNGSNWYQARNGYVWNEEGIYSSQTLSSEYENFSSEHGSLIIIGRQHFDYGNENISLDITDTFNKFITGEIKNYGIGIAFSPMLEMSNTNIQQYVGFFTQHTHTFFEPYVETSYNDIINDDRGKFYLDKTNKLYFYSNIGGNPTNLDELPVCDVNGSQIVSKQATKGVYYIELNFPSDEYDENTMYYDNWTNLIYNGRKFKDVELDFVTKPSNEYFQLGNAHDIPHQYLPNITGINYDERIKRGDIRKLIVTARIPYTVNQYQLIDGMRYRLYVQNGTSEIDIIPYHPINRSFNNNYFILDTSELVPNEYFIDIEIESDLEVKYHRALLKFTIINDETETYV